MQTRRLLKVISLPIAIIMAAGSLTAAPTVQSAGADWNFPGEASELLREIQSTANRLTRDAATLESYGRAGVNWESHSSQLAVAREHINAIGERVQRLRAIHRVAAPWQQQAIDSIVPVAINLASRTEAAILYLEENRDHLWAPVYTGHLKRISDHADQMKESVDLHLELASTQEKLVELRGKLAAMPS
jgi:hypothetical protein